MKWPAVAQQVFELLGAVLGEGRGALLLVDLVVGGLELEDEGVDGVVHFRTVLERTGNDQRRAGLVDQDRIDLVDDRVIVTALHHRGAVVFHVVAQIVEAELVVGGVGDVGGVGGAALVVGEAVHDDADGQAEKFVDAAHPFGVALGEVVVDGDDVDALAGERIEIDGKRGDQRLALAGAHLGDAAIVQHHAADELDVEGPHAEHAARPPRARWRRPGTSRSSSEAPLATSAPELVGAGGELGVGKRLELVFHGVDRLHPRPGRLDAAIVGGTEDLAGDDAETDHPVVLSIRNCAGGRRLNPRTMKPGRIRNRKSARKNGSGRKDEGQIRGATTDVNARRLRHRAPNSATIRRVSRRSNSPTGEFSMLFSSRRAAFAKLALPLSLLAALAARRPPRKPRRRPPAAEAAPAAAPDPAKIVATIDGQPISEAELALAWPASTSNIAQLPPEQRRAAAFMAILEIRLLAAKAVAKGLDKDADFQRRMAFLQQRALHSELIDKDVGAKITDAEIRARYDKQMADTPPVNEVKARHILVKTKEEAAAIIKQLDGGADFVKLANENTNDPSGKTTGGDLGYFGPGQMVPEFEKAALALEVGAYTKEPVQTQFGWHVIKVEDKRAQQPPAFEQVKDQIRSLVFRENTSPWSPNCAPQPRLTSPIRS